MFTVSDGGRLPDIMPVISVVDGEEIFCRAVILRLSWVNSGQVRLLLIIENCLTEIGRLY